nr:immunoglobulin heavy chain junction region [Macaca mulatta]MOV87675.1 immunoglobulin heavy chain junction region [Macaca mulatta]MOV88595.1 immunoglobulin heavy chain junction region [Macaca mulatta]MOV88915.1 immunoglobulin heavy chain junction region [Macaca mulatta]MOV89120.1 immunoglobulin heavy chain junction region [Macaca mulatta]
CARVSYVYNSLDVW